TNQLVTGNIMTITDMFKLDGRVAIITGGGGDLGSAVGLALAKAGAKVAFADINLAVAEQRAGVIAEQGFDATGVAVDVSSEDSAAAMARQVAERFGRIAILVNAAA